MHWTCKSSALDPKSKTNGLAHTQQSKEIYMTEEEAIRRLKDKLSKYRKELEQLNRKPKNKWTDYDFRDEDYLLDNIERTEISLDNF